MNTPTHLVVNWSLARASGQEYPLGAVLLGSVAPDIPLYLLSLSGAAYYGWGKGLPANEVAAKIWGELFFRDPWWIALHNFLHSPLMLVLLLGGLWLALGKAGFLGSWWTWLLLSCLAHTLVDIPVHHNDGPLILWPIDWTGWSRFHSPVSYWHPGYYGVPCMIFEACLVIGLTARLAWPRVGVWFSPAAN